MHINKYKREQGGRAAEQRREAGQQVSSDANLSTELATDIITFL